MNESLVMVKRDGPAAFITLSRPERRNALTLEMLKLLHRRLSDEADRRECSVVVIGAEGPVFSSGHDLKEIQSSGDEHLGEIFRACTDLMEFIRAMPQPVIARVQGLATAAGCQLVAACDLALASEEASFAVPGVKIGLFCSTPMVPLSRAVGRKKALEMLLTGEPITAGEALAQGLVNRVVPAGALDAEVERLVETISRFSRVVVAGGKETFYRQIEMAEAEAYRTTACAMAENAGGGEAREGISAFLEKREARWKK